MVIQRVNQPGSWLVWNLDSSFPLFTRLNMLSVTNQFYDSVCQIEKASKFSIPSRTCIALDWGVIWIYIGEGYLMTQESFPLPALKIYITLTQDVTELSLKRFEFHNGHRRRINPFYCLEESYRHDLSGVWVSTTILHFKFCVIRVCLMFYSL